MMHTEHRVPRPRGFRETSERATRFGAFAREGGVVFRVFADAAADVRVRFFDAAKGEPTAIHPMVAREGGV